MFSKTSSLGIKIRGLEAFVILCGGSVVSNSELGDGLDGSLEPSKSSKANSSTILDKYTVQEKVVPLMRAMKTKEPAVMMAALAVFKQVGKIADTDFLAMDVLPILWSFSLGLLLNLEQFQEFIDLIKTLSSRIEQEQVRKLRDLSSSNINGRSNTSRSNDLMNMGSTNALYGMNLGDDVGENDFERLVLGNGGVSGTNNDILGESLKPSPLRTPSTQVQELPLFSWSTPAMSTALNQYSASYSNQGSRAITPDQSLNASITLNSMSSGSGIAAQSNSNGLSAMTSMQPTNPTATWFTTNNAARVTQSSQTAQPQSNFSIPPPSQTPNAFTNFSIAPPPLQPQRANSSHNYGGGLAANLNGSMSNSLAKPTQPSQMKGLDAYESLL